MPNTLVHIGTQGPLNSMFGKGASPQWMLLGCIIPDIPWILQRILKFIPGIDPYALLLYSLNQASLFFCLFMAAALALSTRRFLHIFLLLSLNCLLHLLLDATQIKWANGVQLLVPFSWSMLRFDWFWPEHISYYVATLAGLLFLAFNWRKIAATDLEITRPTAGKTTIIACLLLFYSAGPFLFFKQALAADNHFCRTLMGQNDRAGKNIELDRVIFFSETKSVRPFSGEVFTLHGPLPDTSGLISVQGYFIDPDTIQVTGFHQHNQYRTVTTFIGLLLIAALWFQSLTVRSRTK
ncbi:MAG: hypothetical protein PHZ02_08015 [Desulfocapsaceae bacterium]|nr:hypothetical protein [Desulfocapsaceae bacterium]